MYILNPVSRCDIGVRDIIVNDFIPKESYLEWLKINNPNQYKENMTKDMVIRQRLYSFLYRQKFFNPNADYLYALDDEDECFITFFVNMTKMFRDVFFLFPLLRNSFKGEDLEIFDKEFGMCSPYNLK